MEKLPGEVIDLVSQRSVGFMSCVKGLSSSPADCNTCTGALRLGMGPWMDCWQLQLEERHCQPASCQRPPCLLLAAHTIQRH